MTEFKVGDRVKVVNDKHTEANNGHAGVITIIADDPVWPISVEFDDNDENKAGDIFDARELELISAATYPDRELRERVLDKAIKSTDFAETTESVLARARAFEAYILGDTK